MTYNQDPEDRTFVVGTSEPDAGQTENVRAMLPVSQPMNYGTLCQCRGTVRPKADLYFDGLYFKMGRGGQTYTKQEVVQSPDATIPSSTLYPSGNTNQVANWNLDEQITADCGPSGGELPNTFYVVSRCINLSTYQPDLEWRVTQFDGLSVESCSTVDATEDTTDSEEASMESLAVGLPGSVNGLPVSPMDSDGDWLLYSGLTASNHFFGNRLLRNGSPLRARLIAVATSNVSWNYTQFPIGMGTKFNRRPIGDLAFEPSRPSPWRFPSLSTNSIVVWQNRFGLPEHVLSSQCRQQPDLVHVDPAEDILVQVNYHAFVQRSIHGQFDMWVKIID